VCKSRVGATSCRRLQCIAAVRPGDHIFSFASIWSGLQLPRGQEDCLLMTSRHKPIHIPCPFGFSLIASYVRVTQCKQNGNKFMLYLKYELYHHVKLKFWLLPSVAEKFKISPRPTRCWRNNSEKLCGTAVLNSLCYLLRTYLPLTSTYYRYKHNLLLSPLNVFLTVCLPACPSVCLSA
jgi:hypothetical protein